MTRRKSIIIGLTFLAAAIIFLMIIVGVSRAEQSVTANIGVVEGSVHEETTFSSLSVIGGSAYYEDTYQSQFRTTQANVVFSKTFGEAGVSTNITTVSDAYITEKEVIGATQVYEQSCVAAAAGSKFVGSAIEYKGIAVPGGIGECAGVGFTADVPMSVGRLSAAVIYRRIGETTIPAVEEGGTDTVVFENTLQKTEITADGTQNDFVFTTEGNACNPAEGPPEEPFFKFELCADPPTGLLPWPHAVE